MALSIPGHLNLKNRVSIPQKRFGGNNVTQEPIGDPGIDVNQEPVGDPGIDDRIYGGGSKDFDESTGRYRSEKDKERVSIPEKRFDKRKQRLLDLQEHRARLKRMRAERRAAREPRPRIPKGEVPSKKPTLRPGAGIIEKRAE
jgi:hypothetical protein